MFGLGKESKNAKLKKRDCPVKICFPARKGGVGKTMIAGNAAAMFANEGYRVLVVCADSQEDLPEKFLSPVESFDLDNHIGISEILDDIDNFEQAVISTPLYKQYRISTGKKLRRKQTSEYFSFDIIPAGNGIDARSGDDIFALKQVLEKKASEYDVVIFDTPPSESEAVMLVLMASDYAVIPVTDRASFKSVQMIFDDIELARENGSSVQCIGVITNNQHGARKLDKFNEELFRESIGNYVFDSVIRSSSSIPNADAFSVPLCSFEQVTQGLEDFASFYEELKTRIANKEDA